MKRARSPIDCLRALRPLLEDPARPKVAHDVKSVLLASAKARASRRAGSRDDVMLYAFLLDADPAGARSKTLARAPSRSASWAPRREQRGRCRRSSSTNGCAPEIEAARLARSCTQTIDLPLARRARAHGAGRASAIDPGELARLSALHGDATSRG